MPQSRNAPVTRRLGRLTAGVAAGLLLAACGSTVPVPGARAGGTAALGSDGMDADPGAAPGGAAPAVQDAGAPAGPAGALPVVHVDAGAAGTVAPTRPATGGPPGSVAPAAWVTTPLQIGVLDVPDSTAFAAQFGYTSSTTHSIQQLTRALVTWYNAHGGIAHRTLQMVEYSADPTTTNYETAYAAACADFTQDHHVAVVLSQTAHQVSESYEGCLSQAHVVHLNGSLGGYQAADYRRFPLLFTSSAVSLDRALRAELKGFTQAGFVTPKDKVGVMVEACPQNVAAYEQTFAPLAKQYHLDVTRRDFDCVYGNGTIAQAASGVTAAVLPFAAAGITKVLWVSSYEGTAVTVFEKQASSQGYAPSYGVSSFATAGAYTSTIDAGTRARVMGVGWVTQADETQPPAPAGQTKRCMDAYRTLGITPSSTSDAMSMEISCGQFFALEQALLLSRGRSDSASLAAALDQVRDGSPLTTGAGLRGGPGHHDLPSLFGVFGYKADCQCFAYRTQPAPLA
jgi:hypothetical protein